MAELTKQIEKRIWDEYMTIKGGDFLQWYDGLSPIEKVTLTKLIEDRK